MSLVDTCRELGLSQRAIARRLGVGLGTAQRMLHGRDAAPRHVELARLGDLLREAGASNAQLRTLADAYPIKKRAQAVASARAQSPIDLKHQSQTEGEDPMLLQNTPITKAALAHFGLPRSPFVDDVQSRDDVYQSPAIRLARAALLDAAQNHGFIALVGESGAGKTTLVEDLEQRIIDDSRDILLIKPYVLGMEASDSKGKTLKAAQIAESVIHALDPHATLRNTPQARFRQMHELLRASRRAGRRHLLVIEEAHCLPLPTLKHLKRFLDQLKDGMQRLIGIALIAQPELRRILSSQNPEVREVMQRCEVVTLPPLDAELEGYVAHKFARFELTPEDVFAPDAFNALRMRLIAVPRGVKPGQPGAVSTCYPLAVHNLIARAMNAAAAAGYPRVDGDVVAHC